MDEQERIPAHPPSPEDVPRHGRRRVMLMTPHMAAIGGMLAFFAVVAMVVILPISTFDPPPGENWAPLPDAAIRGRAVYLSNGCVYCHSGFTRPQDVVQDLYYLYPRVATPGDYTDTPSPNVLGSERTGPDLSQEGGMHPDGWHRAHYANPRNTMPRSIMPRFSFLTDQQLSDLIAYNQRSGGKQAYLRYAAVRTGETLMRINGGKMDPADAFPDLVSELQASGDYRADGKPTDKAPWGLPWKLTWHMNSFDRAYWTTDNPLDVTEQNLLAGKIVYLDRCSGCHGVKGDGKGTAADYLMPGPFDFTSDEMDAAGASDGQMYHRILTAGPGTAMEDFGQRLTVEQTWQVVLFLRTIRHGGLEEAVPTPDMYDQWEPPQAMLDYIEMNPTTDQSPGPAPSLDLDPFMKAARWVAPGMDENDVIYVGGKLPMTLHRLAELIRQDYVHMLDQAYTEAEARGDELPPRSLAMSTDGLEFHAP